MRATGSAVVNARDRIGSGPWFNAMGVQIAASVDDLHGPAKELTGRTALDEHGNIVLGGIHDILTGSNPDGTCASPIPRLRSESPSTRAPRGAQRAGRRTTSAMLTT